MSNPFVPLNKIMKAPPYLGGMDDIVLGLDYIPVISKEDIDKQFIYRYLARKSNDEESEIVEIQESKYYTLQSVPLYTVVRIAWRIAGEIEDKPPIYTGVKTSNEKSLELAEQKMPGIRKKLTNPLQYYQMR